MLPVTRGAVCGPCQGTLFIAENNRSLEFVIRRVARDFWDRDEVPQRLAVGWSCILLRARRQHHKYRCQQDQRGIQSCSHIIPLRCFRFWRTPYFPGLSGTLRLAFFALASYVTVMVPVSFSCPRMEHL